MYERIALLHYAAPPGVGGVEVTVAHHARILSDLGYTVRVIAGQGTLFDSRVEMIIHPLIGSHDPRIRTIKQTLDRGEVSPLFEVLTAEITGVLADALAGCTMCIVHNAHTLHKNLPLTAALHRLKLPLIALCHDLAWTNDQYRAELYDAYPWNLLKQPWPNTRYITISHARQHELAALLGIEPATIPVLPPGIDLAQFFHWTPTMRFVCDALGLPDADTLLLLPARLTRRKNIALALHIVRALIDLDGRDHRLIVTGPPGPHNPGNASYLDELLALRQALHLDAHVHFLYTLSQPATAEAGSTPLIPDDPTLANLYQLADALLFPSTQEGFGIPILEAGIVGLPIFCAGIAPLRETAHNDAVYFDPEHDPPTHIAARLHGFLQSSPQHRLKVRTRHHHRWEVIVREQLIPLLEVAP